MERNNNKWKNAPFSNDLKKSQVDTILNRLVCQLLENHAFLENTVLIGLQSKGVFLAKRIQEVLQRR